MKFSLQGTVLTFISTLVIEQRGEESQNVLEAFDYISPMKVTWVSCFCPGFRNV